MSSLNAPRTTDWVVGRRRAPFYVADPAPGFRPDLLFCLDLGRTAVHAAEVIAALFALPHPEPVTLERRIERDGATTELSLTAPCPGLDWHWLDETAVDATRREDSEAILDDYLRTIRAGGATVEDEREVADLIDHLLQFKIADANEPPLGWSAGHVEAFLLDYFPARVGSEAPAVSRTPERLEAFCLAGIGRVRARRRRGRHPRSHPRRPARVRAARARPVQLRTGQGCRAGDAP